MGPAMRSARAPQSLSLDANDVFTDVFHERKRLALEISSTRDSAPGIEPIRGVCSANTCTELAESFMADCSMLLSKMFVHALDSPR